MSLTDQNTPILTSTGWMPLYQVTPGTLVWTHKSRWQPVSSVLVKDSSIVKRQYFVGVGNNGYLFGLTRDHLTWTVQGWIWASDCAQRSLQMYAAQNMPVVSGADFGPFPGLTWRILLAAILNYFTSSDPVVNAWIAQVRAEPVGHDYAYIGKGWFADSLSLFPTLYDLMVAEDRSFTAAGLILHDYCEPPLTPTLP